MLKSIIIGLVIVLVPVLGHAAINSTVYKVQVKLDNYGYECGQADGVMGQATINAIKIFQQDYLLPQTGEIDKATLSALGLSTADPIPNEQAHTSVAVVAPSEDQDSPPDSQDSIVTKGGRVVQGVGSAVTSIGEQHSDSLMGKGVRFMGKMYTSWGNNLVDVGEGKKNVGEATGSIVQDTLSEVEKVNDSTD